FGEIFRENVKQLFECFCEVAAPIREKPAWILQKYPNSFSDEEILKSVPKFAYPCEFENLLVQHFSFVLTSIDSKWTFGFCRHDPKTETALVVLSTLPWHETFYKLLNHIASLTSNASGEDPWKFLEIIYTCGVPVPGNSISIPLPNSTANFICQSPKQFQLPSIPENRNLTEYYSAVDSYNMMMIFASMLYERRIIFISKRLSRLSACVQACNALIYPMIWQHIYIPVLPLSLIDYLLAPMPFLIGVPTLTLQKVPKSDLGEVVILDADSNTIESPFQDLESLPQDVVTNLKKALRNRSALLGDGVSRAFLRALVQLTAGYREALTLQQGERITFNQNAFVESRPSSMQPFLRKMLELQIFQQFIEERLNMLNSGLGFSDEFEMEACSYSAKSSSKFMQQYREWTYTMRKESSAFFRSVKDKASVKYAVRSVKDRGKDMKTAYKGLKWKGRLNRSETNMRFHQPRSAPSSPTLDRRPIGFTSPPKSPNGVSVAINCRKDLRSRNNNFTDTSRKQYSPLNPSSPEESDSPLERINIDLMHELQDVIFPNIPPVDKMVLFDSAASLFYLHRMLTGSVNRTGECDISCGDTVDTLDTNRHTSLSIYNFVQTQSTHFGCFPFRRHKPTQYNTLKHSLPRLSGTRYVQCVYRKNFSSRISDIFRISDRIPEQCLLKKKRKKCREKIVTLQQCSFLSIFSTIFSSCIVLTLIFSNSLALHISMALSSFKSAILNSFSCAVASATPSTILSRIMSCSSTQSQFCANFLSSFRKLSMGSLAGKAFQKYYRGDATPETRGNASDPLEWSDKTVQLTLNGVNSSMGQGKYRACAQLHSRRCGGKYKRNLDSSDVPDLIRLDSINSNDDFDPLLSKSSEFSSTKQMSQSLHLPEMGEGLSNPLYPYFQQPSHKINDKPKASDNVGDTDLLQAYGIDFSKFNLSNGDNSSTINTAACNQSDNSINDTMDTFSLTLDAPTIKSQNNWTKFE
ncbi:DENN domain-containing protein 1A, partial [Trachymyrmex cornetzi]